MANSESPLGGNQRPDGGKFRDILGIIAGIIVKGHPLGGLSTDKKSFRSQFIVFLGRLSAA